MAVNESTVREHYNNREEDKRAELSRSGSLEFHYTKKLAGEYIGPSDRVLEVGCATGYYGMHFAPLCREYVGVDIVPEHIELFREKIAGSGLANLSAQVGDATNLAGIADGSFDVVLALGPMYHLPIEEREKVFGECARVCKPGGVVMFAYMNAIGAYMDACITWPETYPAKEVNRCILDKGLDDLRPELFFFTNPEAMTAGAERHGLAVLRNSGVNFAYRSLNIDEMDEEKFAAWMELNDAMVDSPSCTGMAVHTLLICQK